jgi:hypothetical protein
VRFSEAFSARYGAGRLLTTPFDLRRRWLFQPDLELEI